ncbi:glycerol-3-phosphate dehydrogenase/oxidase [Acerihabitans sp. TG2]|uniref:glycerol-3-phosphate dehydrogenase/oxidase n=1 Tax=Acerihabitans sp. TG2 TaxID=3096008 RepID=UPI002B223081|nr:glycerol-3-phosphate dehydrogenase/oxidase [Acerihabitans sp. TG2]MEA9391629.1 glycerol-3-phosphate dehydrogenase/oxidase [Acerihabitans sp. TG2]
MLNSDACDRAERLAKLRRRDEIPVLIVGGGINGISTFRELALQGVPAIIVEQQDWCQGASGALSRMIHGGLRYLETGEFTLVKESVTERDRLLKNAPHYVQPLRTTVPIDAYCSGLVNAGKRFLGWSERPSRRGALVIKAGLTLYDLYTRESGVMPRHHLAGAKETRRQWPAFNDWVKCSATYYDAWINYPERLGYELIEDTEQENPEALALNYLSVVGHANGRVTLRDESTGERFTLTPQVVVNATGAWVDQLNGVLLPPAETGKMIGGTKGSHLIIRCPELLAALQDGMVYYENQEGRVCILFPYFGHVLVGSTDIRTDDPNDVICSGDEVRYILDSLRFVFPHIDIADKDILYTFAGIRPLPVSDTSVNGRISRNHSLKTIAAAPGRPFSTVCLVGGKWTTFRAFGEQAADRVLTLIGARRIVSTVDMAIGGGRNFPIAGARAAWIDRLVAQYGLTRGQVTRWVERYGSRIEQLLPFAAQSHDRPLKNRPDYTVNELRWIMVYEQVVVPEDLLVRRTAMAIAGQLTCALVEEIVELFAAERGWDHTLAQTHLRRTFTHLASYHGLSALSDIAIEDPLDVSQS